MKKGIKKRPQDKIKSQEKEKEHKENWTIQMVSV